MPPLICEDLAPYGVVLIPPSAAEYSGLLAGIEKQLRVRADGAPPVDDDALSRALEHATNASAILINRARVPIASVAYFWSVRTRDGRVAPHSFLPGTNPSVLLPLGLSGRRLKVNAFWNTILPGSKRLVTVSGAWLGDNTDVRTPEADELWHGGFFSLSAGANDEELERLRLTLDGVFFVDGGFAGPNRLGSWEHTVFAKEALLAYGAAARGAHSASDFVAQVRQRTGDPKWPPPPPPPLESGPNPDAIREYEETAIGWTVMEMVRHSGEAAVKASFETLIDAPGPALHRL